MNIHFILVETSHPGNIGSAARAIKTMGFHNLILVNPKQFPDKQANIFASHADDVLEDAVIEKDFETAISKMDLIIGTSARSRNLPWKMLAPRDLEDCIQNYKSNNNIQNIGIIFGRERTGLTNEELAACHFHLQIPTSNEYMSLNLSQAVQVIAYELQLTIKSLNKITIEHPEEFDRLATREELKGFYDHMESALLDIGYLDPKRPKKLKERLHRLFQRTMLESKEIDLLRGIFSRIEKK